MDALGEFRVQPILAPHGDAVREAKRVREDALLLRAVTDLIIEQDDEEARNRRTKMRTHFKQKTLTDAYRTRKMTRLRSMR